MYYGLAYMLYLTALRWVPASIASVAFYLIPLFGVGAATLVGERLEPAQWVGAGIVIVAVACVGLLAARPQPSSAAASTQIAATPSRSSLR
jgi:drug/metabolite transporter (DMT)-like permease